MEAIGLTVNREYALRIFGVGTLMLAMCSWSLYDGLVAYPRQNDVFARLAPRLGAEPSVTAGALLEKNDVGETRVRLVYDEAGAKLPKKLVTRLAELKKRADRRTVATAAKPAAVGEQHAWLRTEVLDKPLWKEQDIQSQFVMAGIVGLLGLLAYGTLAYRFTRRVSLDAAGLHGFGVRPIAAADVGGVDWTRWQDKGIIRLTMRDGRRVTLDAWHYAGVVRVAEWLKEIGFNEEKKA